MKSRSMTQEDLKYDKYFSTSYRERDKRCFEKLVSLQKSSIVKQLQEQTKNIHGRVVLKHKKTQNDKNQRRRFCVFDESMVRQEKDDEFYQMKIERRQIIEGRKGVIY